MEILLCDDDAFSIELNEVYVRQFFRERGLEWHIQAFSKPNEVLKEYVRKHRINIAILDIDMGNQKDGIELARFLKKNYPNIYIIYVTEHEEFSFEAFGVAAFALIPKPLKKEELTEHLKRAIIYINGLHVTREPSNLIKVGDTFVAKANIVCIEKDKRSVIVFTMKKQYSFTSGLNTLKAQLPEYFVYANRSTIINAKCVAEINKKNVHMINERIYKLSKAKLDDVYIKLKPYISK